MLSFPCSHCGRRLKVKEKAAGRKANCPHCGKPFTVPAPVATPSPGGPAFHDESEAPTLPPVDRRPVAHTAETRSDADPQSGPSVTDAPTAAGPGAELTDFLAPPQGPGEIGRLGPYRVLKVLGAGGMGVVYQAEDPDLRRLVALKAMLPALAASASARERFLREARSAAAIDHDNIVHIYQVGTDRGVPFLAMQFLQGETLDDRLKRSAKITTADVLRIARETASGLAAAHKVGLIHRDIKPANLWLEAETGRVKILDFGLARAAGDDAHLTKTGAIMGTPSYMAPEQAAGKAVDARADLFSLGCVLYRLCTGRLPFQGGDTIAVLVAVATEEPPPPRQVNPRLPAGLSDLVMKLLAKKPEDRPASGQAVIEAVRALEADPTEVTAPRALPKKSRAPALGRRLLPVVVGAGLALLLLAAGGYFAWRHTHKPRDTAPEGPAAVHLFNGRDLGNFYTYLGTPRGAKEPLGRDKDPENVFAVQDGMIHITGRVFGCLTTREEHANYRLIVEYKWGDKTWPPVEGQARSSGVLLHAVGADGAVRGAWPEAVKCGMVEGGTGTLQPYTGAGMPRMTTEGEERDKVAWYKPGDPPLPIDGPGVRLDPTFRAPPKEWKNVKGYRSPDDAENAVGEWNRLECVCAGDKLTVVLNGQTVNAVTDLSHTHGKIGLVSGGAELFVRTLDLQPLDGYRKTTPPDEAPWQALFNGKDLSGWVVQDGKAPADNWGVASGGVLWTHGRDHDAWLMSEREFSDFELRLEYRIHPGTNSGVALRTPPGMSPTKGGLEVQLIDDITDKRFKPNERNGALWDVAPPLASPGHLFPKWSHIHITAHGRRIGAEINGVRVLDADLDRYDELSGKHPGLLRSKGRIGLQSLLNPCDFREIYVRPLAGGKGP
jgi:serine/threonine protein kinase